MNAPPGEITKLLDDWRQGDRRAEADVLALVYDELQRIAEGYLRRERTGHTLEATALVHETYLRLLRQRRTVFQNRSQFFALAARMMRRILIDYQRQRSSAKRGGDAVKVSLQENIPGRRAKETRIEQLDEALRELAEVDERKASIIELRFYGGLSIQETAEALGCSPRTVAYDWEVARAWLARALL